MRTRFTSSRVLTILALSLSAVLLPGMAAADSSKNKGLTQEALDDLHDSGVDKYLGAFTPISSTDVPGPGGWVKHTFDPAGGDGPICIAGTPYSAFTREGQEQDKLLIMLQGGGACWQDFYNCNIFAEDQEPPPPPVGIWDFDSKDNPFRNYSVVYMPYCDGSVFGGDNEVFDPNFPLGFLTDGVRFHRGLRNVSAGMDLAKETFPDAARITVAGSSAGGVGAAAFAPFLARFLYGNNGDLTVFNDAGPIAVNLGFASPPNPDCDPNNPNDDPPCCFTGDIACEAVVARAADWQFGQFYPASCTECSALGQQTAIIDWRLDNDRTVREAFYETDADATNRFFTITPNPVAYRALIVSQHGALNDAHPDRYKTFIVSGGDTSHTALQRPLFYSQDADGVLLNEWADDFIRKRPFWVNIVEAYDPGP